MTDQNNRQIKKEFMPGDIVQYIRKFWKLLNQTENVISGVTDVLDHPMIILKSVIVATRPACEYDETDKDKIDYFMYDVLQGDKRFEISEAWVELVK